MRILFDIGHPAHVHFFKNTIKKLEEKGHEIKITARDKDSAPELLEKAGFDYINVGKPKAGILGKAGAMIKFDYRIYNTARDFRPDILAGFCSPYLAHVSAAIKKPYISFLDTESARLNIFLNNPFADAVCTPECFLNDYGRKHVRFRGYKELAYLHPDVFLPDISVLDDLGVGKDETYIILRFISWAASHDIGLKGIKNPREIVESLEQYGRIFISSEKKTDRGLQKYAINISPDKFHSLLAFADLYIGEGGTISTEAAVLGTPAIHIESDSNGRATGEGSGNFLELRDKYELLFFYPGQKEATEKAAEILEDKSSGLRWQKKKENLLRDKINVTEWMADFIEKYPEIYLYKHDNTERR
ncbi:DUF354 domain-containing protein [Methanoplanus limicola]|uniref:DUF354 domain-containing protein n=1 Tax=Methanoplanus limicola DSM 2279 TaxID=937775 RepID=H1YZR9_9EURY|nr:DUF354 domain-containing protein [Methanoplanus limicola]EHQ34331.1 protein of unknown function DUF354 [Methanoplanus limicola DSM 2279]